MAGKSLANWAVRVFLLNWVFKKFVWVVRAGLTLQVLIMGPVVALGTMYVMGSRVDWPGVMETLAGWKDSVSAFFSV